MPTQKAQKRAVETRQQLPPEQRGALLRTLKARFEKHMNRHHDLQWSAVQARLEANPDKLWSLHEMERTGGEPDVVLSDMASPTTGHRRTDHLRTMHLCEVAADFAVSVLKPGGHFLAKTFQGGTENTLLDMLKKNFRSVHHVKPPASRDESAELYLLARGFKGR